MIRASHLAGLLAALCASGCTVPGQSPFAPVDTTPPTVTFALPAQGASGVPTDAAISVWFSEPMNWDSVTASAFTLTAGPEQATGHLDRTAQDTQQMVRFVPDAPLTPGVVWRLTVAGTVEDSYFNPMGQAFVRDFTPTDTPIAFLVSRTSPADGATGVDPSSTVEVTFSRPIPDRFADAQHLFLEKASGGRVSAVVGPVTGSGGLTVDLKPREALAAGTDYQVHVTSDVESLDAQVLGAEFVSDFTTAP
jgi:methionine-rich copper-binding protein CopC